MVARARENPDDEASLKSLGSLNASPFIDWASRICDRLLGTRLAVRTELDSTGQKIAGQKIAVATVNWSVILDGLVSRACAGSRVAAGTRA